MPIRTEPVLPEEDWQLRLESPSDGSGVGTLTLDYPEKLNMWSWEATRQLGVLADRARFDDRIRVLLVKAEGRAFCAGVDLGMPEDRVTGRSPAEKVRNYYEGIRWVHERFRVFHDLPQPIVGRRPGLLPRLRLRAGPHVRHPGGGRRRRSSPCPRRRSACPSTPAATSGWRTRSVPARQAARPDRPPHHGRRGPAPRHRPAGDDPRRARPDGRRRSPPRSPPTPPWPCSPSSAPSTPSPTAGLSEALRFEALSASVEFVSDDMPAGYAAKAKKQQAEFEGK